jgi:hypothetical protein
MKRLFSMFLVIIMITVLSAPGLTQAATVKISKTKATLEVDATLQLKITGSDSTVKWTSSKETVATVSKKGLVTAVKAGTATITASVDGKDYSCSIFVVNSKNVSIAVGETVEFTSGEYIVGEDIPAGTYTLEIRNGYGAIKSYITEVEYDKDGYNYKSMWLSSLDENAKIYKNFKLKKGNYLIISDGMIVDFIRKK